MQPKHRPSHTTARVIGLPFVGLLQGGVGVFLFHHTPLGTLGNSFLAASLCLPVWGAFFYATRQRVPPTPRGTGVA